MSAYYNRWKHRNDLAMDKYGTVPGFAIGMAVNDLNSVHDLETISPVLANPALSGAIIGGVSGLIFASGGPVTATGGGATMGSLATLGLTAQQIAGKYADDALEGRIHPIDAIVEAPQEILETVKELPNILSEAPSYITDETESELKKIINASVSKDIKSFGNQLLNLF